MFTFDMSRFDDRDLNDTLRALHFLLTAVAEQQDNVGVQYLAAIMSDEAERRNQGDIGDEVGVELPLGEMRPSHIWCLTRFVCALCEKAAHGEPSEMGRFFAGVVNEIERGVGLMQVARLN